MNKFELIGEVDVDAGLLMVGDPCYHIQRESHEGWINWLNENELLSGKDSACLKHPGGHVGAGVVLSTAYGDGSYPVYKVGEGSFVVITEWTDNYGTVADSLRALAKELERLQEEYEDQTE